MTQEIDKKQNILWVYGLIEIACVWFAFYNWTACSLFESCDGMSRGIAYVYGFFPIIIFVAVLIAHLFKLESIKKLNGFVNKTNKILISISIILILAVYPVSSLINQHVNDANERRYEVKQAETRNSIADEASRAYDSYFNKFQSYQKISAVNGFSLKLESGDTVELFGRVRSIGNTAEAMDNYQKRSDSFEKFIQENLIGKNIIIKLPGRNDFISEYQFFNSYPTVLVYYNNELINSKFIPTYMVPELDKYTNQ